MWPRSSSPTTVLGVLRAFTTFDRFDLSSIWLSTLFTNPKGHHPVKSNLITPDEVMLGLRTFSGHATCFFFFFNSGTSLILPILTPWYNIILHQNSRTATANDPPSTLSCMPGRPVHYIGVPIISVYPSYWLYQLCVTPALNLVCHAMWVEAFEC